MLPAEFADLEGFSDWCLPSERERYQKRLSSSMQEMQAFYDAIAPRAEEAIAHCDKFSLGDYTVTVAGVFTSPNPAEENYIYTHLEYLQRRRGQNLVGSVTQLEVLLEPGVDAEQQCRAIDTALRGGPVETETRPKGVFQAKSLADLTQSLALVRYLGLACIGLVVMLVTTTTVMAVQDRIREHATLQTLGFTTLRIFGLVLSESTIVSTAGGVTGVCLAMAFLSWSDLAVGADAVTISFTPSVGLALTGLAVSVGTGLVAGIFPGWKAATAEIVPALREL